MFILRMIFRSFSRQFRRRLLVAITICLSSAVATAMLGVVFDVGDKLNEELSATAPTSSSNPNRTRWSPTCTRRWTAATPNRPPSSRKAISRRSKRSSGHTTSPTSHRNSICTRTSPPAPAAMPQPCPSSAPGSTPHCIWPRGNFGRRRTRHALVVDHQRTLGADDADEAMIGADLADQLHIDAPGMTITLSRGNAAATVTVVGIYDSGDEENGAVYVPLGDVAGTERPDRQCRRGGGQKH